MDLDAGYRPTRDEMRAIVATARELYRFACRWQRLARLPGYPVDRGNLAALGALFRLERALNPTKQTHVGAARFGLTARNWPDGVVDGIAWLDNVLGILLDRHGIRSMEVAADFRAWAASKDRLPETVAIRDDELDALREAIRLLPRPEIDPGRSDREKRSRSEENDVGIRELARILDRPELDAIRVASSLPIPGTNAGSAQDSAVSAASAARLMDMTAVVLFGPQNRPHVLGKLTARLGFAQYRVVSALVAAGDGGLTTRLLVEKSGVTDAVNVLKRLARSDPDWAAVISLPGRPGGLGYSIRLPTETGSTQEPPENPRTTSMDSHGVARTTGIQS